MALHHTRGANLGARSPGGIINASKTGGSLTPIRKLLIITNLILLSYGAPSIAFAIDCNSVLTKKTGGWYMAPGPATGNEPGALYSIVGGLASYSGSCTPDAGTRYLTWWYPKRPGSATMPEWRTPSGRPGFQSLAPTGYNATYSGAYESASVSLTCVGASGTHSSTNAPSNLGSNAGNSFLMIPCIPRTDGTVQLDIQVNSGGVFANDRGQVPTANTNITGSNTQTAAFSTSGIVQLADDSTMNAIRNGTYYMQTGVKTGWMYTTVQIRPLGDAASQSIEACTVSLGQTELDFGTVARRDLDSVQVAGHGTASPKETDLNFNCQGNGTASVWDGLRARSADNMGGPAGGNYVPDDNMAGLAWRISAVGADGNECLQLASGAGCNRLSTDGGTPAKRQITPGTNSSWRWVIRANPALMPGATSVSVGRARTVIVLEHWYSN